MWPGLSFTAEFSWSLIDLAPNALGIESAHRVLSWESIGEPSRGLSQELDRLQSEGSILEFDRIQELNNELDRELNEELNGELNEELDGELDPMAQPDSSMENSMKSSGLIGDLKLRFSIKG